MKVTAIAMLPQMTTRTAVGTSGAPPALAPASPSEARAVRSVTHENTAAAATDVQIAFHHVQAIGDTRPARSQIVGDLLVVCGDPVAAEAVVPKQQPSRDCGLEPVMGVRAQPFSHVHRADDHVLQYGGAQFRVGRHCRQEPLNCDSQDLPIPAAHHRAVRRAAVTGGRRPARHPFATGESDLDATGLFERDHGVDREIGMLDRITLVEQQCPATDPLQFEMRFDQ